MFGLFSDKKKIEQEVQLVMANYTTICLSFKETMYHRLGVKKEALTEKDIQEMRQDAVNFNKVLSTVSTRVKNDFITAILCSKPNEFNLDTLFEQMKVATYLKLLEEGKVEITQK